MSTFQTFDQASRDMHQAWAPDADTAESPYDIERIDFALQWPAIPVSFFMLIY